MFSDAVDDSEEVVVVRDSDALLDARKCQMLVVAGADQTDIDRHGDIDATAT